MVRMMRIRGVEISRKHNVQNKLQFRKVSKQCKSYIHCARHVRNDAKLQFRKVSNALNLIYTLCAMLEMML